MIAPGPAGAPLSLAGVKSGDLVRVAEMAFESVRARCWALRVEVGDVVRCVDTSVIGVTVERSDGRKALVPPECARFVLVHSLGGQAEVGAGDLLAREGGLRPDAGRKAYN